MTAKAGAWVKVAKRADVGQNQVKVVAAGEERIALCHLPSGGFYAVKDVCTHDDGPLGEGHLVDGDLECPRHGGRFDPKTGAATRMPAIVPVKVYPVKLEGEDILVQV